MRGAIICACFLALLAVINAQNALPLGDGRVVFTNQTVGAFYVSDLRFGSTQRIVIPGFTLPIKEAIPTTTGGVHSVFAIANPSKDWHYPVNGVSSLVLYQGGQAFKILHQNISGIALAVDAEAGFVFANFGNQVARLNLATFTVDLVLESFSAPTIAVDTDNKWVFYTNPFDSLRHRIYRRNYDGSGMTLVLDSFAAANSPIVSIEPLPNNCIMYLHRTENPNYGVYVNILAGWCWLSASRTFGSGSSRDTYHFSSFTYDKKSHNLYLSRYTEWYNSKSAAWIIRGTMNSNYTGSVDTLRTVDYISDVGSMRISYAPCSSDCSGNGVCNTHDVSCTCMADYFGSTCEAFCSAKVTCNNHGACSSNGQCDCSPNYSGQFCEKQIYFPQNFPATFSVNITEQTGTNVVSYRRNASMPTPTQDLKVLINDEFSTSTTLLIYLGFTGHMWTYTSSSCQLLPPPQIPLYQPGVYVEYAGTSNCLGDSTVCVSWRSVSSTTATYRMYQNNLLGAWVPFDITSSSTTWTYEPTSWSTVVDWDAFVIPYICPKP